MNTKEAVAKRILQLCNGFDITLRDFFDSPIFENIEQEIK